MKKNTYNLGVVAALLTGSSAFAGDADAFTPMSVSEPIPDSGSGWDFSFSPYLWGASLGGEVGIGDVTTDIDLSFSDILDNMDIGAMGAFEARKGRWGILFDAFWLKLDASADTPGDNFGGADVEVEEIRLSALLSYRVMDGPTSLDLVAGASYFSMDTDIDLLPGASGAASLSSSEDWVDPIIGFNLKHDFSEKWYAMLRGQIGGFDVGSDFTWQAIAGLGYRFNQCSSLVLGYRHLDIDYDDNDFIYNTETSGAFLGMTFEF